MDATIDRSDIVWIVVASNHYWGAANSLHDAMRNANLPEPKSPAEWFAEELEYEFDLDRAAKDWKEWGRKDSSAASGDVHTILIYRFDPALWSDYSVGGIDGGVSFTHREGMECDWGKEMDKAWIAAEYKDGVLKPTKKK